MGHSSCHGNSNLNEEDHTVVRAICHISVVFLPCVYVFFLCIVISWSPSYSCFPIMANFSFPLYCSHGRFFKFCCFYICNGNSIFVDMANVTTHPWQILHFSLPWQYIVFTCHGEFSTYIAMPNLLVKFWKILKHDKLLKIPCGKGAAAARSSRHRCKGRR